MERTNFKPKKEMVCPNCGQPDNRAHRRHNQQGGDLTTSAKKLYLAGQRYSQTVGPRNTAHGQVRNGGAYAEFLYSSDDPFLEYAEGSRCFSDAYQQTKGIKASGLEKRLIDGSRIAEIWSVAIANTSLRDIERMPMPLETADIRRIGRFLRHNRFTITSENQRLAHEVALLLPTQSVSRTKFVGKSQDRPLPSNLTDTARRMAGFMDFYLGFLTDPNLTFNNLSLLGLSFSWIGMPFWRAMGHYTPARMGISPSSAIKLIKPVADSIGFFGVDRKIIQAVTNETKNAFRPDALPPHLHSFLQFDKSMDREAGLQLIDYYSNRKAGNQADVTLMQRLARYRKSLIGDIRSAGLELRLQLPEHPAIGELILTAQYTTTLMLILQLRRGNTHVTLEVDYSNRIYGTPANLLRENPHITGLIAADIFPVIFGYAARKHPEVESAPPVKIITGSHALREPVLANTAKVQIDISGEDMEDAREEIRAERARRRLVKLASALAPLLEHQPDLPEAVKARTPLFTVMHTRTEVGEILGKYVSEELIDRVMRKTRDFELGNVRVTALKKDPDLFRVRVGKNYRVIYRHLGNGIFKIESFGRRDKVYEDN